MIFIIDPTRTAMLPCPTYCHIKPCYGVNGGPEIK